MGINQSLFKGKITAVTNTTITDTNQNFIVNEFAGYTVVMVCANVTGIANYVPQHNLILSNTATVITVNTTWTLNPLVGDEYYILPFAPPTGSIVGPPAPVDVLLLNNATQASFPYTSANQTIGSSKHVDVLFTFGAFTGGASPTVQMKLQILEKTSATVIRTYNGAALSAAGNDNISVDGLTLGDTVNVTIVATGAPTNITGAYLRMVAK